MINRTDTRILTRNPNGYVIEISETEVGKVLYNNSRTQLEMEAAKLKYANEINDLLVKFIRIDTDDTETNGLVTERLYPLQFRALSIEHRVKLYNDFERKLIELHEKGFVHNDISHASTHLVDRQTLKQDYPLYSNVILTNSSLRLIDVGISFLKIDIGIIRFEDRVRIELGNLQDFKTIFLNGYDPNVTAE